MREKIVPGNCSFNFGKRKWSLYAKSELHWREATDFPLELLAQFLSLERCMCLVLSWNRMMSSRNILGRLHWVADTFFAHTKQITARTSKRVKFFKLLAISIALKFLWTDTVYHHNRYKTTSPISLHPAKKNSFDSNHFSNAAVCTFFVNSLRFILFNVCIQYRSSIILFTFDNIVVVFTINIVTYYFQCCWGIHVSFQSFSCHNISVLIAFYWKYFKFQYFEPKVVFYWR